MKVTKQISRTLNIVVKDTAVPHVKLMYTRFDDMDKDMFSYGYIHADVVESTIENLNSMNFETITFTPSNLIISNYHKKKNYTTKRVVVVSDDDDESTLRSYDDYDVWVPKSFGDPFPDNANMYYHIGYNNTFYRVSDEQICATMLKEFVCENMNAFYQIDDIANKVDWLEIYNTSYVPGNGKTKYYSVYLTSDEMQKFINKQNTGICNLEYISKLKGYPYGSN